MVEEKNDLLTVIMPMYNTPYDYSVNAIKSILNQTYSNFELLVIDDNSTEYNDFDRIVTLVGKDCRIKFIKNHRNKGVAGALNTGLEYAQGKYIFRMDSDDISKPDRLTKQYLYMESHPEVSILAGDTIDFGEIHKRRRYPRNNIAIKTVMIFKCPIAHPTVCIRRDVFSNYNYSEQMKFEDYDLWMRCALNKNIIFSSISYPVLNYRVYSSQTSQVVNNPIQNKQLNDIRREYLQELIGNNHFSLKEEIETIVSFLSRGSRLSSRCVFSAEKKIALAIFMNKKGLFNNNRKFLFSYWKRCTRESILRIIMGDVSFFPYVIKSIYMTINSMFYKRKTHVQ